jgi:hypothetical protein
MSVQRKMLTVIVFFRSAGDERIDERTTELVAKSTGETEIVVTQRHKR